jgi:hypothetical protein
LQKNLNHFGDPSSCEAGKSCVYPILKDSLTVIKSYKSIQSVSSVFQLYLYPHGRYKSAPIAIGANEDAQSIVAGLTKFKNSEAINPLFLYASFRHRAAFLFYK